MSLLIDATPLQSEHRQRGVGAYLRSLIAAIEALGAAPKYLVSSNGDAPSLPLPSDRQIRIYRPHRPAQVYWMYNELALRVGLARTRPEVFFAPDFNGLIPNPYGRTVAVLHDLTHLKLAAGEAATGQSLSLRLDALRWSTYNRKLRQADLILAVSRSSAQDATRLLGIPEQRLRVVHHGVDHAHFRPSQGQGPYAHEGTYFVNLGGRNDNKNQARLLEAFAQLARQRPELRLFFAGPWSAADLSWLETERTQLGLGTQVKHLGYVSDADLPSLYANAAAFVFPSLEEGFGMPVLEAMASGAAVITSERSSLPEVAGDAARLVNPANIEALAAAMSELLSDPAEAARLRQAGLRRAAEFTWERTARQTLQVIGAV